MVQTLSGENSYLLRSTVKKLVDTFVEKYGDFGLEKINAEEATYQRIFESVTSLPFLADKRMVIIESPSANKGLIENCKVLIDSINDQTDVIFVESTFDKRSRLYKYLKKNTDFKEFTELSEQELSSWIVDKVIHQNGKISINDARNLVHRVGTNQQQLSHELDKLLSFSPIVSKQSIELLTSQKPSSTIFDLLEASLHGDQRRALTIYEQQRNQKVEPQEILALLGWQLKVLAIVKTGGTMSPDNVARDAKINPFVVRKTAVLTRKLSITDIKSLVARTLDLDMKLKSVNIDADEAVKNLLITLVEK